MAIDRDREHPQRGGQLSIPNEEFTELTAEEQQRLIDYKDSVRAAEQAKGRRILFERAPSETLPFVAYCVFVGVNALGAIILLIGYSGTKWPFFILIGVSMVAPLFALPSGSFSNTIAWVREYLSFRRSSE